MLGALNLFRRKQVQVAFIELNSMEIYGNASRALEVYGHIVDFGYMLTTFNCYPGRGGDDTFTRSNWNDFVWYANLPLSNKWRCPDVKAHFNPVEPACAC